MTAARPNRSQAGSNVQPVYQPLTRHLEALPATNRPAPATKAGGRQMAPSCAQLPRSWTNLWRVVRLLSLLVIGGVFAVALNDVIPTSRNNALPPPQTSSSALVIPPAMPTPLPDAASETATAAPAALPAVTPNPLFATTVVCLDPGHGGADQGYERKPDQAYAGTSEAGYNLAIALALRDRLIEHGFSVVLTRESNTAVNMLDLDINGDGKTGKDGITEAEQILNRNLDEFAARIKKCNASNADLLVSIHINGYPDETANGYETWFNSSRPFHLFSQRFATLVYEELGNAITAAGYEARGRGVNDDLTAKVEDPHQKLRHYVMIGPPQKGVPEPSVMPGAIVESLFISNDDDAAFLASDSGQQAIAAAYEQATVRYFEETLADQ